MVCLAIKGELDYEVYQIYYTYIILHFVVIM